jgi:hypothetical protein
MIFRLEFSRIAKEQLLVLEKNNAKKYKIVCKALGLLSINPKHPSLNTHKFNKFKGYEDMDIFEAYAENNTPNAYRIFWFYGVGRDIITIVAIIPHP